MPGEQGENQRGGEGHDHRKVVLQRQTQPVQQNGAQKQGAHIPEQQHNKGGAEALKEKPLKKAVPDQLLYRHGAEHADPQGQEGDHGQ